MSATRAAQTLLFFVALSWLCMGAHESAHHIAGRAVCGAWGTMTLATFFLPDSCQTVDARWIATLAGPLLTYVLLYLGVALRSRFGLFLIFANLPLARLFTVAMRGGDEMVVGRLFLGEMAWPVMLAITVALLALPLAYAWRRLPAQGRLWMLPALLIVPMLWDFGFKRVLLGAILPAEPAWNGFPVAILASYAIAAAVAAAFWPRRQEAEFELEWA